MSSQVERDVQTVNRWLGEGKTLAPHTGHPPYAGGKHALEAGERFASEKGMKGPVRLLFLKEVSEGWITPSNLENVNEAGLLDWLSKPLSAAVLTPFLGSSGAAKVAGGIEAPGAGSSKVKRNPSTGKLETETTPGVGEATASAVGGIGGAIVEAVKAIVGGYGVRLLEIVAGGALVLFALFTLAKGQPPKLSGALRA